MKFIFVLFVWNINVFGFDIAQNGTFVTPTYQVANQDLPEFLDDLNFEGLQLAIDRQLISYDNRPPKGTIKFGERTYALSAVADTLRAFRTRLIKAKTCFRQSRRKLDKLDCYQKLQRTVAKNFDVYAPLLNENDPRYGTQEPTFFTAYYTPTLQGSRVPSREFPYAIYKQPKESDLKSLSRVEIDFDQKLANKGYEIFYIRDLFEQYLLHVQGGGKIELNEGKGTSSFYLHFDGSNGQKFKFISKYMHEKGYIPNKSIDAQRKFLSEHPELQREIYENCLGYIYFKAGTTPPPGSTDVSLTPRRSIATDKNYYAFKGVLSFVQAKRPEDMQTQSETKFKNFSRFMLDQDTGSAILGKARVDLYHGEDKYAEKAAYSTQHTGRIYFLMLKSKKRRGR